MNLRKLIYPAAFLLALGVGIVASAQFDGTPSSPLNFKDSSEFAEWDVQVHSRSPEHWDTLESMQAQHGADCSGPPASHENHTYEGATFICNNHLMTSIKDEAYGVIYLTPNKLVNFCDGAATIQWDMSTQRMSTRDWVDWWITPYLENLALPFDLGDVDLQSVPMTGFHIDAGNGQGNPQIRTIHNGVEDSSYSGNWGDTGRALGAGIAGSVNQSAVRQTMKITVSRTHIKMERLASATAPALTFFDYATSDAGFCTGVFQIGHHSYNPEKDNSGVPGTWHWDEVQISPSQDFTIIHAQQRYTDGGVVHFEAPAPANSYLRFAAIGQVTVNGNVVQPQMPTIHPDHFNSYFVPIAEGATSVTIGLSADGGYNGPRRAQDFSIFSLGGISSTSTSTPTAPSTAAPTQTAISPTSTPTSTATSSPTATATSTPTSTVIPPTSTPTPTPTNVLCYRSNDGGQTIVKVAC